MTTEEGRGENCHIPVDLTAEWRYAASVWNYVGNGEGLNMDWVVEPLSS